MEDIYMKILKMKEEYDWYSENEYMEISDELAEFFETERKKEEAYDRKRRRYKATNSLDADNGIEKAVLYPPKTPEQLYVEKEADKERYAAMLQLPEIQRRRYYAYYYLKINMPRIARIEGVSKSTVSQTIDKAEKNIKKILERGLTFC